MLYVCKFFHCFNPDCFFFFYCLLLIFGKGNIVLGSNYRNGYFHKFARFKISPEGKNCFFGGLSLCMCVCQLSAWIITGIKNLICYICFTCKFWMKHFMKMDDYCTEFYNHLQNVLCRVKWFQHYHYPLVNPELSWLASTMNGEVGSFSPTHCFLFDFG